MILLYAGLVYQMRLSPTFNCSPPLPFPLVYLDVQLDFFLYFGFSFLSALPFLSVAFRGCGVSIAFGIDVMPTLSLEVTHSITLVGIFCLAETLGLYIRVERGYSRV